MEKLMALRAQMKERGLDAYIITGSDSHSSEYVCSYWQVREWISGFTGSNGIIVVTHDNAGLWTDGRYFIQAAKELAGSGIDLYKSGEPNVPTYQNFLKDNLTSEPRIGFDGRTLTAFDFMGIQKTLDTKKVSYAYQEDVAGNLWAARPPVPTGKAFEHAPEFAGSINKLEAVREKMKKENISAYLITALDDIAWLANIRGNDIPNTPVVYAYALITEKDASLFIDLNKAAPVAEMLKAKGFNLFDYHALTAKLKRVNVPAGTSLLYNSKKTNVLLSESIPSGIKTTRKPEADIIPLLKAVKSETELKNIRNAYIRESIVFVKMLKWLEEAKEPLTEGKIAAFLSQERKKQPNCLGDSFNTIAAYGANAALMHYRAEGEGASIGPEGFVLVDTGGQYLDGTTDTTRTIPMGPPTPEMIKDFTLVLKGHINLASTQFLSGTTGFTLDAIARRPLWQHGLNYKSGTGHGIGYCLGVHEGPHGISAALNTVALTPGMLVSNEPGIYKEGKYGIRTENILVVRQSVKTDDGEFLNFEPLTLCPINTKVIDKSLLTVCEIEYVNSYHRQVYETLSPMLDDGEAKWLEIATQGI